MFYEYGKKEIDYLKKKDKKLAEIIDRIGMVRRPVDDDIFTAIVRAILGQQISRKARETVFLRMETAMGKISPNVMYRYSVEALQSFGTTFKKAEYIHDFAGMVIYKEIELDELYNLSDEEVIEKLSQIKGIGKWTAEMLLTSALQRKNIFSFSDIAIHRGLRMVYHHKEITKELFEKYRKRYSPYGTVASIYLWEVAAGEIPEMKDYRPLKKGGKNDRR